MTRANACVLLLPLFLAAPAATMAADVILNEYNAVDDTKLLENGASDVFWGSRPGNGGDWFEVVVVTDHLDVRGWEFIVVNRAGDPAEESFSITLSSHSAWSDLRSGTIITVSENLGNNVGDYNPAVGRWWINVRASPKTSGTYATVQCLNPVCLPADVNWKISNNDTQITIKDMLGSVVFGPAGEGVQPTGGVGSTEVFKLEQDPTGTVTPLSVFYKDGSSSTFGQPNVFSAGSQVQDLGILRSIVPYEPLTTVRINEVLSHSDPGLDWIELYNPTAQSVDIGDWYLSDSFTNLTRFRIPTGTVVPPGGYLVFDELDLGFAFSSPCGDEAILSVGDGVAPTGPRDFAEFGALPTAVSYGRSPNGTGVWTPLSASTPGAFNAPPAAGPVVINEVMYHPPDPGVTVTVDPEFVELYNSSAVSMDLFTDFGSLGIHPWKITGGIDLEFPLATSVPAGGFLLLVPFDPNTEPVLLAEFRSVYGLDSATPIVGPYQGKLGNFSDTIRLRRPDTPEPNGDICGGLGNPSPFVPYVIVDEVTYVDFGEWPEAADGAGSSLERIAAASVATEPRSWAASGPAGPTPGGVNRVAVWPTKDQQRCIVASNRDLGKGAKTSGGNALRCVKDGSNDRLSGLSIEACLTADRKGRLAKVSGKTRKDYARNCSGIAADGFPRYPSFGATDPETVNGTAIGRPVDFLHDVFGDDLGVSTIARVVNKVAAKCQQTLAKDALRCIGVFAREFGFCAKIGLAKGLVASEAELVDCLGNDSRGKIAASCDATSGRIGRDLPKRCSGLGVDLATAFPGCSSGDESVVSRCLASAASCRACLLFGEGGRLGPDCDVFDDGLANGSCL